jgi:hypothetical protein
VALDDEAVAGAGLVAVGRVRRRGSLALNGGGGSLRRHRGRHGIQVAVKYGGCEVAILPLGAPVGIGAFTDAADPASA